VLSSNANWARVLDAGRQVRVLHLIVAVQPLKLGLHRLHERPSEVVGREELAQRRELLQPRSPPLLRARAALGGRSGGRSGGLGRKVLVVVVVVVFLRFCRRFAFAVVPLQQPLSRPLRRVRATAFMRGECSRWMKT
jgi:hypothetical protein